MEKIKVGVVGIGHLGSYHLQKYSILPQCEIAGVADVIAAKASDAALKYQCPVVADYRELFGAVAAVSICVPTAAHYQVARDFLLAGIHVLVEKPFTATLAEADELIAIALQKGLVLQVGMVERFNPAIMALDRLNIRPL